MDAVEKLTSAIKMVEEARSVPLSASCVVHRGELLGILDEAKEALPDSIAKAELILENKDKVIDEGRLQAEKMISMAREEASQLIEQTAIMQQAREEAKNILAQARAEHALGATKAAEGGGALGVGFATMADQFQSRDVITVVDVQTSAVVDRAGVIGAVPATRHQGDVGTQNATVGVKTHFVIDAEIMALAGDGHVVVAVDAQLDRLLQLEGRQSRALAEDAGVALFAPKAAAHAATDDFYVAGAEVECSSGLSFAFKAHEE